MNENLLQRNHEMFDRLVPATGKCDTIGGEILRAVNRIGYRWWNDGDKAGEGYGRETVNPAVRFLTEAVKKHNLSDKVNPDNFEDTVAEFQYMVEDGNEIDDDEYEEFVNSLVRNALDIIVSRELDKKENDMGDMFDYADRNVDYDRDDDEYDDEWDDDYECEEC